MRGKNINLKKYKKSRHLAFERDEYKCQGCGFQCISFEESSGKNDPRRASLDHVVPVGDGGAIYDIGNMQTLCSACHKKKTKKENEEREDPNAAFISCVLCKETIRGKRSFRNHMAFC